jgi:hypothetical protein
MGLDQANGLTDLLQRAPLAGFLALTLLVVVVLFTMLMREKSAHQDTIREVVKLTATMSEQWNNSLALQEEAAKFDQALRFVLERVVERLDSRRRSTGAHGPIPAPGASPPIGSGLEPVSKVTRLPDEVLAAIRSKVGNE